MSNMENLEWPHLEVFKAACRVEPNPTDDQAANNQELVRIFKKLKNYIFISLTDQDASDTGIEILETFTWRFKDIRDECLNESLEIMVKTLRLLYQPDIEDIC
jgi:IS4 transposase